MIRKNKRKGFTLIELLAVIVILGLLMVIAIPSVTKYITQSRKRSVATTIGNYMSALTAQVNNMDYTFTDSNMVYAVPIECISLERGGSDPFGEWHQASKDYWAYVLVKYDDNISSYTYGFTFKDSAGYGLYPTTVDKLNEDGIQIQTGLSLEKPKNGTIEKITNLINWNGFEVNENTELKVLKARPEGKIGNGIDTCTLVQKGSNYEEVQPDVKNLTMVIYSANKYFWVYKDKIKTITFEDSINIPNEVTDEFKWDISTTQKGKVMAYIVENKENPELYDLYIQGDEYIYANANSSYWFSGFTNVDSINNIELLNTSNVTNMRDMFNSTGYNSKIFSLDLGDYFNTSKVGDMRSMFSNTGYSSTVFTLDLGDNFDTSNVANMNGMFVGTGYSSTVFTLDLGDNFNTSKVQDMAYMFTSTGYSSPVFTLDLGDKFDTIKVYSTANMFLRTGYSSKVFTLDLGDKFDTSGVSNMTNMFNRTGYSSSVFTLDLGDKFNTINVTLMNWMFSLTGYKSTVFKLNCSNWNVDKVTGHTQFNLSVESKVTPPTWKN